MAKDLAAKKDGSPDSKERAASKSVPKKSSKTLNNSQSLIEEFKDVDEDDHGSDPEHSDGEEGEKEKELELQT